MKKLQLLILSLLMVSTAVFAYNFDNTIPVKGKSITDSQLQSQMIMPIYYYSLRVAAQGCEDFAIVNTDISKPKNNNTWSKSLHKNCKNSYKLYARCRKNRLCNWLYEC